MPKNADANVTTTLAYLDTIISAEAILAMVNYLPNNEQKIHFFS